MKTHLPRNRISFLVFYRFGSCVLLAEAHVKEADRANLQVAQPVRARVELRRVCLVRVSSAKRWVPPRAAAPPADLLEDADADVDVDADAGEELKVRQR